MGVRGIKDIRDIKGIRGIRGIRGIKDIRAIRDIRVEKWEVRKGKISIKHRAELRAILTTHDSRLTTRQLTHNE